VAKITPTQNLSSQNQDPIVLSTSAVGKLKRAVNATAITPTGSDYDAAAQMVGTHGDDAVFTPNSTEPVVVIGAFADETATDSVDEGDAGAIRMTLDRRMHVVAGQDTGNSTYEIAQGNINVTLLVSAARTATLQSADRTNSNGRGVHVVVDVTSAGTGSITLTIQGKDALSGKYYTLLAGAAVTTNSTNIYKVFPGATAVANAAANDILPRTWRIDVTHNNANSITYSVGATVIV
jgi:hypothetical protein